MYTKLTILLCLFGLSRAGIYPSFGYGLAPTYASSYSAPIVNAIGSAVYDAPISYDASAVTIAEPAVAYPGAVTYASGPAVTYTSGPAVAYASGPAVQYAPAPAVQYAPAPAVTYASAPLTLPTYSSRYAYAPELQYSGYAYGSKYAW